MSNQDDLKNSIKLKTHWDKVYAEKTINSVSWFQAHPDYSLRFLQETKVGKSASIIDVGGGASTFVDELLSAGYKNLTVLDISETVLLVVKNRLKKTAQQVNWLVADVTKVTLPAHSVDVWHDRAVFHFLTSAEDRNAYIKNVLHSVKSNGHVIIATFAEDGPIQCSGLQAARYSAESLHETLGKAFTLISYEKEPHYTPSGKVQQFLYAHFQITGQSVG